MSRKELKLWLASKQMSYLPRGGAVAVPPTLAGLVPAALLLAGLTSAVLTLAGLALAVLAGCNPMAIPDSGTIVKGNSGGYSFEELAVRGCEQGKHVSDCQLLARAYETGKLSEYDRVARNPQLVLKY